jgi:dihydropteroate synthase
MGVINVTPDSFADPTHLVPIDGQSPDVARAVGTAVAMEAAGADLLDIGGESTRPGATAVSEEEELARVVPVVQAVARLVGIPVSVDTHKPRVAASAIEAGAAMINDISGLRDSAELGGVAARTGAALILMHMRGRSTTMYELASYTDLIGEVTTELEASIALAERAGVPRDRIVIDPGIGFAKRAEHSYGVLAYLPELASRVGRPVLVGPSRKSFLQEAAGGRPPHERDWATAGAVAAAVLAGAHIVRVHAVAEMVQVVRVAEAIRLAAAAREHDHGTET